MSIAVFQTLRKKMVSLQKLMGRKIGPLCPTLTVVLISCLDWKAGTKSTALRSDEIAFSFMGVLVENISFSISAISTVLAWLLRDCPLWFKICVLYSIALQLGRFNFCKKKSAQMHTVHCKLYFPRLPLKFPNTPNIIP